MTTVPNSTAPNAGSPDTSKAIKGLNSNYQDFLKLLTTQLQHQDPTAPADTNQITQQIASLSQVEQQINTNSNLQQLISLMNASQMNNAVGYIGKQIDATGNEIDLSGGASALVYSLPSVAASAKVTITNSTGQTVFTGDGTTLAGRNQLLWNGTNNATGEAMPSGSYTFKVEAKDNAGADMTVTTFTTGLVTAVEAKDGLNSLSIGSISVPMDTVKSIYTAGTNPSAS